MLISNENRETYHNRFGGENSLYLKLFQTYRGGVITLRSSCICIPSLQTQNSTRQDYSLEQDQ